MTDRDFEIGTFNEQGLVEWLREFLSLHGPGLSPARLGKIKGYIDSLEAGVANFELPDLGFCTELVQNVAHPEPTLAPHRFMEPTWNGRTRGSEAGSLMRSGRSFRLSSTFLTAAGVWPTDSVDSCLVTGNGCRRPMRGRSRYVSSSWKRGAERSSYRILKRILRSSPFASGQDQRNRKTRPCWMPWKK